jgi:plastocyanin
MEDSHHAEAVRDDPARGWHGPYHGVRRRGGSQRSARPAASVAGAQQVTLEVGNGMWFKPASIEVQAGQPVELTLRNTGAIRHDFALAEGVSKRVKVSADGGKTARATFTVERPGTYTFVCSVSGHAEVGMRGTIAAR